MREGQAQVALTFERNPSLPPERYRAMSVRARFGAHAIGKDGSRADRRIQNWYFTTDEFSRNSRLWRAGITEYGLGGVWVYPSERL